MLGLKACITTASKFFLIIRELVVGKTITSKCFVYLDTDNILKKQNVDSRSLGGGPAGGAPGAGAMGLGVWSVA